MADFLRARGIGHNVASVELVTHVLHLWNRSQFFFQQLWNWSHFLGPIPQLPRQLWNWSQPKMHLWNRAQKEKNEILAVTYSNFTILNCDLFQFSQIEL